MAGSTRLAPLSRQRLRVMGAGIGRRHVRLHNRSGVAGKSISRDAAEFQTRLLSQAQPRDQIVISIDVAALQIIEQAAALADQLEQTPTRMIVFLVRLEMIRQFIDPLRQQRHLHLRRTGVGRVRLVLRDDA